MAGLYFDEDAIITRDVGKKLPKELTLRYARSADGAIGTDIYTVSHLSYM